MDQSDIGARLSVIAQEASNLILPLWRAGVAVDRKADESPVTEADRRAESLILQRLAAEFPEIPIISEEDASEFGTPDSIGPRFFLVDPLDGTKAFIRQDVHFTVNIALIDNGMPIAGSVVAPATGEMWRTAPDGARKRTGDGAECAVRVRPRPADPVGLISHTLKAEALQGLKAQYGFDRTEAMDSSIKLCRIAEGAADLYPRHGTTMEWDIAAGHAVLLAAGGAVTTPEGGAFVYGKADEGFRNGWFVARGG
ncbi:MAG TPA: 3'(2'),5'-bisphosphate nucleotidase CysQ [Caulobacteraceae bacterium]|jgi:3'(2'), 5'-bisphosphate nucleotidase|nr:3'(2'),5'-bisphosphate nucleotidase CysQ [Caulobacteraceae bacterium]